MTHTSAPSRPTSAAPDPSPAARSQGHYGELPQLAGRAFLPIAFAARLPFSMLTIGILVLVTQATGSVAIGGLVGAASAIGTALGGPTQGSLADRIGQRRVLLAAVPITVVAVVGLLFATAANAPTAVLLIVAAITGAAVPQVGPLARVRWLALAEGRPKVLSAAMSYESTADEIGFVLGPAAVGILASIGSPQVAIVAAAILVAVFGTAFALHPTARMIPTHVATPGTGGRRLLQALAAPLAGMMAMGVLFGGMQTAVTEFTRNAGTPGMAGLVYAVMGVGSAVTALSVVALPSRWSLRSRWISFAAALTISAALLAIISGTGSLGVVVAGLALVGLSVGPVMVTVFSVAGRAAPAGRTAAAMTVVASANVVGVALGAAVGGHFAQDVSTSAAFLVPAVAAAALMVAGWASSSRSR